MYLYFLSLLIPIHTIPHFNPYVIHKTSWWFDLMSAPWKVQHSIQNSPISCQSRPVLLCSVSWRFPINFLQFGASHSKTAGNVLVQFCYSTHICCSCLFQFYILMVRIIFTSCFGISSYTSSSCHRIFLLLFRLICCKHVYHDYKNVSG
jgi:hypothetical protein